MSWWWSGAISVAKKKMAEDESILSNHYQSVGLIVGVTGIVGNSLAEILPRSDTPFVSFFPFSYIFRLKDRVAKAVDLKDENLRKDIVDFHGEMVLLENYSALNYTELKTMGKGKEL